MRELNEEQTRKDDLRIRGFQVWQHRNIFCFGLDGVLLADYARSQKGLRIVDLCSGTGIVPFLLLAKEQADDVTALELQPALCRLMERSREENGCQNQLTIVEGDLKEADRLLPRGAYDLVTVNPPYEPLHRGLASPNPFREIARREAACTLMDVIDAAAHLLKSEGRLVLVHRPYRMGEVFSALERRRFKLSRLRLVEPYQGEKARFFLLEAILNGRCELSVEPTLIVHQTGGALTREVSDIYQREWKE